METKAGPLAGTKIIELGGIGPVPFCATILAELGAEVIRLDRPPGFDGGIDMDGKYNLLNRSRKSLGIDLKNPQSVEIVLRLVSQADALIEGFRPGTAERLGLGPDACMEANAALVYGRMTGWGQDGPLAQEPGHDVNYISLSGVLHSVGRAGEPPTIPLNLIGDFGGGTLYLAIGVLSAIIEARQSGKGQVVDAAMVDGSASLMTIIYGALAAGYWNDARGTNRLDSGAPWYNVYETSDGKYVSIAANETRFYHNAVKLLGLDADSLPGQHDKSGWPTMKETFATAFKSRKRDEWVELAAGKETCIAPVLSLTEAPDNEHLRIRQTFVNHNGIVQPAPAPRFSRTPAQIKSPPAAPGQHTDEILAEWGFSETEITALRESSAVR
ncbi:CaiB/BaiF CoA-transferase family protein [Sedimentitalea sp.]|uniref:CaiB/BaiF CoA transferase family protein n=1 Tax=Sedimentitalea sp. TaxID=2048915 RepID=UPI0032990B62